MVKFKRDFSNETTLKNELKKGNHKAFVFLMDSYHHALCSYIYSLSNNYDDAQDIVQNVFVKLWENRKNIHRIKYVKNFLYKSAYNGFIDQWRKDKRMLAIEAKHIKILNKLIENEDGNLLKKQSDLLKIKIQELPDRCKETFLLSKREGLTNIEIANFMKVSSRTVENQLNKAFKILRKKIAIKSESFLFMLYQRIYK